MPVRKISNRAGGLIGKFPSVKMEKMIGFESLLERDYIYLLDYDSEVESFEEQPLKIDYQYEGKSLHYTPDFHLVEKGRNVLVECKPDIFVNTEENQRKALVALDWCTEHNWEFRFVTDKQIRPGFRLQNVKILARYARQNVSPMMQSDIRAIVHQGKATINEVAKAISPDNKLLAIASILYMVFHHQIWIPIDTAPLSEETFISPSLVKQRRSK